MWIISSKGVLSRCAHTNLYQLCTISLFVYEIPFYIHTHNHTLSKVVEAKYERMKDQSN